ncbi:hypothetical protein BD309DRAFT_883325 [Dichomitus squalens]|uniref:Uncharacterized protein n=1 Tax=Dichomitus squalens TaxID=114155 RepID=A0A4Q9P5U0_9APHY|nr:hypothetical protein BD309DRAFT_883325 [Dichomitus squalens]TBU64149.1 hypothetical protein BD310DRAFT_840483 [Dichomitus squalens]
MAPPSSPLDSRSTASQGSGNSTRSSSPHSASTSATSLFGSEEEMQLLNLEPSIEDATDEHEVITAPLLTRGAYEAAGMALKKSQYGVLGSVSAICEKGGSYKPHDPRLYVNTNAPFSAIVCGVQGSGKSHTVSVLLENMLVSGCAAIGNSHKTLSGLVLHFGEGGSGSLPCEAAFIGQSRIEGACPPKVKVYVSRSSIHTMRRVYSVLGDNVSLEPLQFSESELDAQAILSMMAIGTSESAPLYMHRVLSILRDLGERFTYAQFLKQIEIAKKEMNAMQTNALDQRLVLLKTYVDGSAAKSKTRFGPGQLTIIDLSDPFIDPPMACALFEIVTRLFVRADVGTGKVLVVDEAHKYLSSNRSFTGLTKALTELTRQQRHLAMRVIISTQEPTVLPPVLIDLCSIAILHRFSSPAWWEAIIKRVSADFSDEDAFDHVVKLKTGEAIILAPSGLGVFPSRTCVGAPGLQHFGRRYLHVRTRRRVTADGGASRMVVQDL